MLSGEISTIYSAESSDGKRVRKLHHVIHFPSFEAAERFSRALERRGNLASDGRPILGIDSRDLVEMALDAHPGVIFIPAHIWTPWFSVLGSKSGFDSIEECYRDLSSEIFAVETGLSSDPPMNWLCSFLDRFTLVSNSDAHSGGNSGEGGEPLRHRAFVSCNAGGAQDPEGVPGDGGVLPRGGEVSPGRTPEVRGVSHAGGDAREGGEVPGVWSAAHRGGWRT